VSRGQDTQVNDVDAISLNSILLTSHPANQPRPRTRANGWSLHSAVRVLVPLNPFIYVI